MVNSGWWYTVALLCKGLGLASAYNECLLAYELKGLDPFESTDWTGMSVCDGSLVAAEVTSNYCTQAFGIRESCYWSVVDCDSDTSCTCQSCGGYRNRDLDEYMIEMAIWDRVRCAVFALEAAGFDLTPCVEAVVDVMSMPGVDEEWTPPSISRLECIAVIADSTASEDEECSYPNSRRFAEEVFGEDAAGLSPAPSAGVVNVATTSPVSYLTPSPSALAETVAPVESVMTPAPQMNAAASPTAAPDISASTPMPGANGGSSGSDSQVTPAPSDDDPGQSLTNSSEGVIASDGESSSGQDSGMSAETIIGITSVIVAFLGVVVGLWGTSSTVYLNCKCCVSDGTGPVVTVGARNPREKWLPLRLASGVHPVHKAAASATAGGSEAIVSSVTVGFEHMSWTPIPPGTGISLRLSVDGRSYVFESCASSAMEGGKRVVVGSIKKAKAVDAEILARLVDIVTVNESCELAAEYASRGHFRILRRCASRASSLSTYAVLETIADPSSVLVLR